ncbi:hypothetical protein PVAND_016559 [Polypedilum vanderplanki]|uniref:Uncharacterized protein n=1 Tax=Polypedilum vanderplanki TaxID=319348 RepID=A0A9J6BG53_POLVA|nr:hypothetical protein PVAND_016559 [Polypedilum vanderplanki]
MNHDTSDSSQQRLINFNKPTPDFNRKFYDLFSQKSMVDVTLSVDGQFLQAHKVVLAVASSWFEELFDFLKDKHPVIVLKDISLQQLHNIIEFIYLGSVAIPEEDANCFRSSLEALRISLDESNQDEEHEQESQEFEQETQDQEEGNDENDIEVEEEVTKNEEQEQKTEPETQKIEPDIEIKKEPEWEDSPVIKEEPIETETVKESSQIIKESTQSNLKVASVTHIPPQLAPAITSGSLRIRTPASINERIKPTESSVISESKIVKVVQKLPTPMTVDKTNIQELSKRLSKAILIRRVKKSDGSFVSERSPVKIIQGVKIQKVNQPGTAQQFIPMRPQVVHPTTRMTMISNEKRILPHFRCSHCSKAFTVNKRRNAHEKYCFKNPSRPSSQCPYCPMVLCNPMYINTHIKKVHGIDDVNSAQQMVIE